MIVDFLRTHRHLYSIERACRVLNEHEYTISPATFYRFQSRGFGPTAAELDVMSRDVVLAPARNDTVPIQEVSVQTACPCH